MLTDKLQRITILNTLAQKNTLKIKNKNPKIIQKIELCH